MTGTVHCLQQLMCGLRGHESVLCFERHRLSLRCLSCGHQTTGWALDAASRHPERIARDLVHSQASGVVRLHRTRDMRACA
jgi:hypothetical protein